MVAIRPVARQDQWFVIAERFVRTANKSSWLGWSLHGGWLAGLVFATMVLLIGAFSPTISWQWHPVGNLGAIGAPFATAWNVMGYIVPAGLLLVFVIGLEVVMRHDGVGVIGRLGTGMLLVSIVAFGAQALFPYVIDELDSPALSRHASMLAISLLGLMAGGLFVAASLRHRGWSAFVSMTTALNAVLLMFLVVPPQDVIPGLSGMAGAAQRLICSGVVVCT